MHTLNPKTLTNDLIGKMSNFTLGNSPSEFEEKLFLREAEKVKNTNLSEGWMLLGIIKALVGDYQKTKKSFENALRYPNDELDVVIINYAKALRNLGKFEESYAIIEKFASPQQPILLEFAFKLALNLGLVSKASEYYEAFRNTNLCNLKDGDYLKKLVTNSKKLKISEKDLNKLHLLVLSSIYEKKKFVIDLSNAVDPETNTLIILFHVEAEAKIIANLELDIIEKLIKSNISAIDSFKLTPIIKSFQDNKQ